MHPRPRRSARTIALALAASVLAAGCQATASIAPTGAASPTPRAAEGSGAPSTGATDGPAGTPIPSLVSLELAAGGPILRPADGPAGSIYAMPAAGARDRDGTLVLAVVWFPTENARPVITIARSTDGATWQVGDTDILAGLEIGTADPGPIPSALVQLDDGSWQLFGWSAANVAGTQFLAWRTSAPALDGPWTIDTLEVLEAGPGGAWDSLMAAAASVQRHDGEYLLWYEGEPPGSSNRGDIGLATSTDGLTWTKLDDPATTDPPFAESDPVIATGICGPGTAVAVEQPQVERLGDRFVAVFGGYGAGEPSMGVWAAVSADGRDWQCATPEQLLTGSDIPGGQGIHTMASVPLADGRMGLILESLGSGSSELWWATVELAAD
jgi:hypothetical protein